MDFYKKQNEKIKNIYLIYLNLYYNFYMALGMENIFGVLPAFLSDALKDSLELVPLLFIVFIAVELFENYFSHKENAFLKYSQKFGPLAGALLAIVPQCGFSVVASTLYIKRLISMGSLIAIYIATSDEAIPILIATPSKIHYLIPLISTKLVLAIIVGYSVDLIFKPNYKQEENIDQNSDLENVEIEACCKHRIPEDSKYSLFIHPIKHTFNIWIFIFAVCVVLNYVFFKFGAQNIAAYTLQNTIFQPIISAFFGLIPNCAISVIITVMFMSGTISFASAIAGLSSNAGLGILVLLRQNKSIKNTLLVLAVLLISSITAGIILQLI